MKTTMMYLNRFLESIIWKIIYLATLALNIYCSFFYKGFLWVNCVVSILMIGAILINPKEFFKPFKRFILDESVKLIIRKIKSSNLSRKDKYKAIKGLKRINRTKESCFAPYHDTDITGLFNWRSTKEGWEFWNKVNQEISKQK